MLCIPVPPQLGIEAGDFRQTIRMTNELNLQVSVLDLHMPDGTEATLLRVKSHLKHDSRLSANDEDTNTLVEGLGTVPLLYKMELGQKLIPTIMQLVSP